MMNYSHTADQPAVGSHPGNPLWLVGLPAPNDARAHHRRVVGDASRGRLCLVCGELYDRDHLRSHQDLAGLGKRRAGGLFWSSTAFVR